jgi:2-dehydro-3-deoxyphosphogluconate aldolase/(4S)-4-hydroxy-2-oxoglutarate aldolase
MNSIGHQKEILDRIIGQGIIAIIRQSSDRNVRHIAEAIAAGGVRAIEITIGTPNALELIARLSEHPDIIPGVGSVVDAPTAIAAIESGAEFVVTPVSRQEVIEAVHQLKKPIFSGAFTPGEIYQAYNWGADVVKVFPADMGIKYFKAIRAPMPYIPLMPTGGINLGNAAEWIINGATCLGIGSTLTNKKAVAEGNWDFIEGTARKFLEVVRETRAAII